MSSRPEPHADQPLDFECKETGAAIVQKLRKVEILLALRRAQLLEWKPTGPELAAEIKGLSRALEEMWYVLHRFYRYPNNYRTNLARGKPMLVEGHIMDGFWGVDLGRSVNLHEDHHQAPGEPQGPPEGQGGEVPS